ncbi:MAG: thiamine-phosphate kinase [Chloroflexi bacterium]|nr:thiamine-phosphate kinase [Chloroflexota bacterium]
MAEPPDYNTPGMNVSDLGEFGLIQRLATALGAAPPESLIVGIGDDAAAWREGTSVLLATTDTLVEGVHFLPAITPWRDLGWKALAVNVSDIAAMGGEPVFALVTLALPPETGVAAVDELYAGLQECAREYGVAVAGGDVVRAPQVVLTVALLGRAQMSDEGEPLLLRRDAAQGAGHVIAVTGALGGAAAGLRRLKEGASAGDPLVRAHLRPRPPLATAQLAARLGVPCAIDISDGLLQDLGHICEMSGLGADLRVNAVPLSADLRAAYPDEALSLACAGGEDYQMLFVAPAETTQELSRSAQDRITVIGEMTESPDHRPRLLDAAGNELHLDDAGWDHLRRG